MGGGWVDGSARDLALTRPLRTGPATRQNRTRSVGFPPQTRLPIEVLQPPQGSSKAPTVSTTASNIDRMDGDAVRMVGEDTKEGEMKSIEKALDKRQCSGATAAVSLATSTFLNETTFGSPQVHA